MPGYVRGKTGVVVSESPHIQFPTPMHTLSADDEHHLISCDVSKILTGGNRIARYDAASL